MERRAAFDIGSGATKLMVADIETGPPARLQQVLFAKEIPVSFTMAWKQSPDGTLSEEIQGKGLEVLQGLLDVCTELQVGPRCAIATEVFRKAKNGADYLRRVKEELHLPVEVLSQDDEAHFGFQTALALCGRPAQDVICWDSGGGSFQITSLSPSATEPSEGSLRSFLGTWGSGNSTAALVEAVQRRGPFASHPSPNPVKAAEAEALITHIKQELPAAPDWLKDAAVVAIGGPNSMFCLTAEILGLLPAASAPSYNLAAVRRALAATLDFSDEELAARHCVGDHRDPPGLCCPKVCLLVAVMEHCGIAEVTFQASIGSCAGLLISSERY